MKDKFSYEFIGPMKAISENMTAIWRAAFGPRVEAGQIWYTDYCAHVSAIVVKVKGPWVYFQWPDKITRRRWLYNFRLCYCLTFE